MTTRVTFIEPAAVIVGLPDEHVVLCHEVIAESGLRVLRPDSLEAACEKIPKALPHLVVASTALPADARAMLEDRAIAVGAVFVVLDAVSGCEEVLRALGEGVDAARARFRRRHAGAPR